MSFPADPACVLCSESFYCGLEQCTIHGEATYNSNITKYDCEKIRCSCIPGRMLCGEDGSVSKYIGEDSG